MPYRDFSELVLNTIKDKDYRFVILDRGADVTVAAIHGGSTEPLTSELATAIAGDDCNLYDFRGLDVQDAKLMRVLPARFNDMRLQNLMKRARLGVSILGIEGAEAVVHVGGRNQHLKRILMARLQEAGFEVRGPCGPGAAHDPSRFYNLPSEGGVQLELTRALRASMLDAPLRDRLWEDAASWNARLVAFIVAVRGALVQYKSELDADLDVALESFERTTQAMPPSLRACDGDNHQAHKT
jgi:phage replication-related protein YjqB (UPF0714/DUF867 family)